MSGKFNGKRMKPWPSMLFKGECPDPYSDVSVAPDGHVYVSVHCVECCIYEVVCGRLEPNGEVITLISDSFDQANERFANRHGYTCEGF